MSGLDALLDEGRRQACICNACRYCEGYCSVFPAMERRLDLTAGDLSQLAHLCHDCRACYQACMYTEPHQFAVNIPRLMSEARIESFEHFSHPRIAGAAFRNGPVALAAITAAAIILVSIVFELVSPSLGLFGITRGPGSLYQTVSHAAMAVPALLLSMFAISLALAAVRDYASQVPTVPRAALSVRILARAAAEAATLRGLDGGGGDCYYPDTATPSPERRAAHHVLVAGILCAFVATLAAAFTEYVLGQRPPYGLISAPVILGTIGGIAIVIACIALLVRNRLRPRSLGSEASARGDTALLISLLIVALTGIVLLIVQKATGELSILVLVHLGAVAALYVFAPYSKLMHAGYRFAAIVVELQERLAES